MNNLNIFKMLTAGFMTLVMFSACQQKKTIRQPSQVLPIGRTVYW